MDANALRSQLGTSAFALRGYNTTNLGRTAELLRHDVYGATVQQWLQDASQAAADILNRPVDLVDRVERGEETGLASYADAIALVISMELAQLDLLRKFFQIEYSEAGLAFGYSLGEITALVAGEVISMEDALRIPLSLADDCVALARDVTLGIFFSRGGALPLHDLRRLCVEINMEGKGVIGISAYLAPNSVLLMGQRDTLKRFKKRMSDIFPERVYLRRNEHRWPPLHTPIVWERTIPNRAALQMHSIAGGLSVPKPRLLSLVTGKMSYNDYNCREILHRWVDHPQRLWDVIYEALVIGVETIVHVGPEPNIIPATFQRLQANVEAQTQGRIGMRALAGIVKRPWLASMLPVRTALLRAPLIRQVVLEDWLLENSPDAVGD